MDIDSPDETLPPDKNRTRPLPRDPTKRRVHLTIEEKCRILKYIDEGYSYSWIEQKTGTPKPSVSSLKKRREVILGAVAASKHAASWKRVRRSSHPELIQRLFAWVDEQKAQDEPCSLQILRRKALALHREMCPSCCQFTCSSGWLEKLCMRRGVELDKFDNSRRDKSLLGAPSGRKDLLNIVRRLDLSLEQIYRIEETDLFWKRVPECSGSELSRDHNSVRITLCSNLTGSNRIPLLVTGNFSSRKSGDLGEPENIKYHPSKNTIQSREVFKEWMSDTFIPKVEEYSKEKQIIPKAVLVVNHDTIYTRYNTMETEGIRVLFLPKDETSNEPTLSERAAYSLKAVYRTKLYNILSDSVWEDELQALKLNEALELLSETWGDVHSTVFVESAKFLLEGYFPYDKKLEGLDAYNLGEVIEDLRKSLQVMDVELSHEEILLWMEKVDTVDSSTSDESNTTRDSITTRGSKTTKQSFHKENDFKQEIEDGYEEYLIAGESCDTTTTGPVDTVEEVPVISIKREPEANFTETRSINLESSFNSLIKYFKDGNEIEKWKIITRWRKEYLESIEDPLFAAK